MPQALITINAVAGSNLDLPINTLVQLNNTNIGGETTYNWTILDQPDGAADSLSNALIQNPTFTPRKEGTYLLRLVVNQGQASEVDNQVVASVLYLKTRNRVPAAGEENEAGVDGWSKPTGVDAVLKLAIDTKSDPGICVAQATAAHAVGSAVYFNGVATLKSGLPGQEVILTVAAALATNLALINRRVGVVLGAVNGGAIGAGSLIYVRTFGIISALDLGACSVGDVVYLSDAGGLVCSTVGPVPTFFRAVGRVISAGAGATDVVDFDGTHAQLVTQEMDLSLIVPHGFNSSLPGLRPQGGQTPGIDWYGAPLNMRIGGQIEITSGTTAVRVSAPVSLGHNNAPAAVADIDGDLAVRVFSPVALSAGNNNDYAGIVDRSFARLTPAAGGSTITGITDGQNGKLLVLINIGANPLTLAHENAGSAAANRLIVEGASDLVLQQNGRALFIYDSTTQRWRHLTAREGGAPSIAEATGSFSLSSAYDYIRINSAGAVTVTLPSPATIGVRRWKILLANNAPGAVTIDRFGAETIQGVAADYLLEGAWSTWELVCDGTNWWLF